MSTRTVATALFNSPEYAEDLLQLIQSTLYYMLCFCHFKTPPYNMAFLYDLSCSAIRFMHSLNSGEKPSTAT
jgi:hypothetical protein